jgi:hypothetical protein
MPQSNEAPSDVVYSTRTIVNSAPVGKGHYTLTLNPTVRATGSPGMSNKPGERQLDGGRIVTGREGHARGVRYKEEEDEKRERIRRSW